jgi:hypothetical protein
MKRVLQAAFTLSSSLVMGVHAKVVRESEFLVGLGQSAHPLPEVQHGVCS